MKIDGFRYGIVVLLLARLFVYWIWVRETV